MMRLQLPGLAAIESLQERARSLWNEREPRERLLLAALGALAAVALLVALVVRPLADARAKALADIRAYEALNFRIRAAGPRLASQTPRRTGDATAIITGSASQYGVPLQGSEPEGEGIRIIIAEAPFDAVIRWLAELEGSSDLRVIVARFDRRPAAGFVAVRLLVTR